MERITLSISTELRDHLHSLAQAEDRSVSEVARGLLEKAFREARRDEFYRKLEKAMTPEARAYALRLVAWMEQVCADER